MYVSVCRVWKRQFSGIREKTFPLYLYVQSCPWEWIVQIQVNLTSHVFTVHVVRLVRLDENTTIVLSSLGIPYVVSHF